MVSKYLIIVLRICYADDELNRINPYVYFLSSLFPFSISGFYLLSCVSYLVPLSSLTPQPQFRRGFIVLIVLTNGAICLFAPSEWQDERPPGPSYIRILYLGKVLQGDDTLSSAF